MRNSYSFAHRPDAWAFGKHDATTTSGQSDAMRQRGEQLRLAMERRQKLEQALQQALDAKR